ncbi:AraC family transcriptional regulator [Thauera butanivorans]|uniref:AraC family transcriptional regulator n=1 Tax=Thauera butanivorans TaxID=86174 RepID=UPI0009FE7A8E|nr:AraC family transcriptional regulator [Thauera butanivorans]
MLIDRLTTLDLLRSEDPDEARAMVAGIFCDHRLDLTERNGRLNYQHRYLRTAVVSFSVMGYGADVRITPRELDDFFLVQLPLKGESRIESGKELRLSRPGNGTIHCPGQSFSMNWSVDCSKLAVRIEREAIERHAASLLGRALRCPLRFDTALDTCRGGGKAWEMSIRQFLRGFQQSPELVAHPLMRAQFEQFIMSGLLLWQENSLSDSLRRPEPGILPRHLKVVEDYMHAHPDAAMTNEQLADLGGVSLRTLYNSFRRFHGMGPMRYLKDLRMEKVREELLDAGRCRNVTQVATRWGFFELGRFAAEYRKRYGESPSDTLRNNP